MSRYGDGRVIASGSRPGTAVEGGSVTDRPAPEDGLAQALAEELTCRYQYDLATSTTTNYDAWARMLGSTPCMALFEDIDAVFRGRETLRGDLTFDCLLNCLDGIEQADGVLTVITTNHPEALDAALCGDICGTSVSRPGRIDRALAPYGVDAAGRHKPASGSCRMTQTPGTISWRPGGYDTGRAVPAAVATPATAVLGCPMTRWRCRS